MNDSAGQHGKPAAWDGSFGGTVPDWTTLDVELKCPRCAYNLRMLTRPRCPECGFIFDWDRLISATRDRSISPLFEFQWRARPVRSLLMTYVRALWPGWIWRNVPIESTPGLKPLAIAATAVLFLYTITGTFVGLTCFVWAVLAYGFFASINISWLPGTSLESLPLRTLLLLAVGAVWGATIFLFRWTYGQFSVRSSQVTRIVVYAWMTYAVWRITGDIAESAVWNVRFIFGVGGMWTVSEPPYIAPYVCDAIAILTALTSAAIGFRRVLPLQAAAKLVLSATLISGLGGYVAGWMIAIYAYQTVDNDFAYLVQGALPAVSWAVERLGYWIFGL